jgi:hypothetical protein
MKTITEIIKPITLLEGSHEDTGQTGQGCFMNVIAYLNGEAQITDKSECVCVTVRPIAIWLNDHLQDDERVRMIPFIERAMGSATTDRDEISRRLALVVTFTEQARDISAQSAEYTKSAAKSAEYAAESAAEYAKSAKSAAQSAKYAAEYAAQSAAPYAEYAAECAQSAAEYAAECAQYATKCAEYAKSAKSAKSAAKSAEIRQQIINAAYEYLDAALPKRDCIDSAVLKRAEKLSEML